MVGRVSERRTDREREEKIKTGRRTFFSLSPPPFPPPVFLCQMSFGSKASLFRAVLFRLQKRDREREGEKRREIKGISSGSPLGAWDGPTFVPWDASEQRLKRGDIEPPSLLCLSPAFFHFLSLSVFRFGTHDFLPWLSTPERAFSLHSAIEREGPLCHVLIEAAKEDRFHLSSCFGTLAAEIEL